MPSVHSISAELLTFEQLENITSNRSKLTLSDASRQKIKHCRTFLEQKIDRSDALIYGINTGFGSLCEVRISHDQTEQLQANLVMSHACGLGEEVPLEVVRLMLLLKIQSLSYGYSGVRTDIVDFLIFLHNEDILPVVYQLGSLGASGDLAPLAHISLAMMGMGEVWYGGERRAAADVLRELGRAPLRFQSKEGLAMLNGTQFSAAYGVWCLLKAARMQQQANLTAALSADAFDCRREPFDPRLHAIRPHAGQVVTADFFYNILKDSELASQNKTHTQDPYSFRCVPQVHGASRDALEYCKNIFLTEINSVTDNPTIFPDDDVVLSGGNFHAQPLALALDFMALALAELGSISERRLYQLIGGKRGLPPFLTASAGLHSGLMIAQYTAASVVSQNKQLCTPASADSIVSCNGQEDHVSMAANAATKAYRVVKNVEQLLAIEWMAAAQALSFRSPLRTAPVLEKLVREYRLHVAVLTDDRILSDDFKKTVEFWKNVELE